VSTLDDLKASGLTWQGSPASTQVSLGPASVTVTAREDGERTTLEARVSVADGVPSDLSAAALGAPGDTTFEHTGGEVVARRTLVSPDAGVAYDAVFELSKSVASLVRLFGDMAFLTAAEVPAPVAASPPTQGVFTPTHAVPPGGMQAWVEPDPRSQTAATLDAGLDLEVAEERGDWARVVASNGWSGWVDMRVLRQK